MRKENVITPANVRTGWLVAEMIKHVRHAFSKDSPQVQGLLELYFERISFILMSDPSIRVRRAAMTLLQLIWVSKCKTCPF